LANDSVKFEFENDSKCANAPFLIHDRAIPCGEADRLWRVWSQALSPLSPTGHITPRRWGMSRCAILDAT